MFYFLVIFFCQRYKLKKQNKQNKQTATFLSDGTSAVGTLVEFSSGVYTAEAGSFSAIFLDPDLNDDKVSISFTYSGLCFKAEAASDCTRNRLCGVCGNRNGYVCD